MKDRQCQCPAQPLIVGSTACTCLLLPLWWLVYSCAWQAEVPPRCMPFLSTNNCPVSISVSTVSRTL